jgi:hypothetical protein
MTPRKIFKLVLGIISYAGALSGLVAIVVVMDYAQKINYLEILSIVCLISTILYIHLTGFGQRQTKKT